MDVDFLGVVIEPCNKKEISCPENTIYHLTSVALDEPYGLKDSNVKVFVEVNDEKFAIGTLSSEMHPHIRVDFCFKKNFQLFHTSLISKVAVCGYQVKNLGKFTDSEGDESDEEVPPGIRLYPKSDDIIKESQHKTSKLSALKSAVVASPMREAFIEETKLYGKSKADDDDNSKHYSDSSGESSDDEDSSSDDGGSCDEEETPSKNTKDKNEQVVTPLKTPPKKTTKLETPILDSKAGTTTGKRSGYVQVANPHPAKQAKKTPANNDTPKRSAGYVCSSCNKPFNSSWV